MSEEKIVLVFVLSFVVSAFGLWRAWAAQKRCNEERCRRKYDH